MEMLFVNLILGEEEINSHALQSQGLVQMNTGGFVLFA